MILDVDAVRAAISDQDGVRKGTARFRWTKATWVGLPMHRQSRGLYSVSDVYTALLNLCMAVNVSAWAHMLPSCDRDASSISSLYRVQCP
jgi:hypothetical protein